LFVPVRVSLLPSILLLPPTRLAFKLGHGDARVSSVLFLTVVRYISTSTLRSLRVTLVVCSPHHAKRGRSRRERWVREEVNNCEGSRGV